MHPRRIPLATTYATTYPTTFATAFGILALVTATSGCVGAIDDRASTAGPDAGGAGGCPGPFGVPMPAAEVASLPTCCEDLLGAAHCVDPGHLPAGTQGLLSTCAAGGLCAPDKELVTGGVYTATPCTSLVGPGACVSVCLAQVAMNAAILTQDVCDAGERCAPCVDPRDGSDTGVCAPRTCTGTDPPPPPPPACDDPATCVYEAGCPPVLDPSTLPSCAPDAHCFDKSLIPADQQSRFAACADASRLCIPDIFLTTGGKFELASCHSLYGGEGRCFSTSMPDIAAQAASLPQDTCTANERCVPCFNPLDGSDTGSCHLACDTGPKAPPTLAPKCCHDIGTCVPTASIPADKQSQLAADSCAADLLCVPDVFTAMTPLTHCAAEMIGISIGEGRCLPDCLAQTGGINGSLMTGDCSAAGPYMKCFPCNDPLSGSPTGLCM